MEPKDTLITNTQLQDLCDKQGYTFHPILMTFGGQLIAKAQAEVSFEAGRKSREEELDIAWGRVAKARRAVLKEVISDLQDTLRGWQ